MGNVVKSGKFSKTATQLQLNSTDFRVLFVTKNTLKSISKLILCRNVLHMSVFSENLHIPTESSEKNLILNITVQI